MVQGLATGIAIVITFAAIALLGWLVGGGARQDTGSGVTVLRYGTLFRGLGVLAAVVIPVVICVILIVTLLTGATRPESTPIALGLAGFFLLLGLPLILEGFRKQAILDESGITVRSWLGRLTHVGWQEVEEVSNRVTRGFFLVRGAGKKVKLGHYLEGLDCFAEECRRRLAPGVYGEAFAKPLNRPFL
jgi:hypothetical protein